MTKTSTMFESSTPFRVLIVGGSLSGLTLALCLEKANIEYLILESGPQIAPQLGASLGLHPHGVKIINSLGAWKPLEELVSPLKANKHFANDGHCFAESHLHAGVHSILGFPIAFLERRQILQELYNSIADKSKVLVNKRVVCYEESDEKVTVTTQDGSTYDGAILVGADGIHSTIRKFMSQAIRREKGDSIDDDRDELAERAFTSQYKTIFGISNRTEKTCPMPDGLVYTGYAPGYSTVAASGVPGSVYWFLFVKNKELTSPPSVPRYTEEDCKSLVEEYRSLKMCESFTVGDIYDAKVKAVLVSLEEGIVDTWSHGRVVLVGDAVHKVTVNAGLGGNMAMEGIVHLSNLLQKMIYPDASVASPKALAPEQISNIFTQYHDKHRPRVDQICGISASLTRVEAQDTTLLRFASRWLIPLIPDWLKIKLYSGFSRGAPIPEFITREL